MSETAHEGGDAGWGDILDPGETILWQGRPDPGFALRWRMVPGVLFGLFFAGFALIWMIMAARAGGGFWMFGLIHFAVGLGLVAVTVAGPVWKRRHTWYTLTDRRAFIATDMPLVGRRLHSYPITGDTTLEFDHNDPATLSFAYRTTGKGRRRRVGFEMIRQGAEVYALMRKVQRGTA